MGNFIGWCVFGLIAGAVARLLTPGKDPMGCLATMLIGVVGSFVGGFLASLIFGGVGNEIQPAGFVGAVIGGILVLLIFRKMSSRR